MDDNDGPEGFLNEEIRVSEPLARGLGVRTLATRVQALDKLSNELLGSEPQYAPSGQGYELLDVLRTSLEFDLEEEGRWDYMEDTDRHRIIVGAAVDALDLDLLVT